MLPMTDEELARFQAKLLDLLSEHRSSAEVVHRLQSDPALSAFRILRGNMGAPHGGGGHRVDPQVGRRGPSDASAADIRDGAA